MTAVLGGDVDTAQLSNLLAHGVATASSTNLSVQDGVSSISVTGFGFTFDGDGDVTGGTSTGGDFNISGGLHGHITGLSTPVLGIATSVEQNTTAQILSTMLSGNDSIVGDSAANTIHGFSGNDTIQRLGRTALLFGDDGDNGDDSLAGGAGEDHLVGGTGGDTLAGGGGANGFEVLPGDSRSSLASGHPKRLDHITDWTSSDFLQFTGGPVMTGRVLDFHPAEGGRVMLDPGATDTLSRVGADTVEPQRRLDLRGLSAGLFGRNGPWSRIHRAGRRRLGRRWRSCGARGTGRARRGARRRIRRDARRDVRRGAHVGTGSGDGRGVGRGSGRGARPPVLRGPHLGRGLHVGVELRIGDWLLRASGGLRQGKP